jgi:hypothetical protein
MLDTPGCSAWGDAFSESSEFVGISTSDRSLLGYL